MRQFHLAYPICAKLSLKLSWSHWVGLLKVGDALERSFYQQQIIEEEWNVPELKRQKDFGTVYVPCILGFYIHVY